MVGAIYQRVLKLVRRVVIILLQPYPMFTSIYPQPSANNHDSSPAIRFPEDVQVIIRSDRAVCGNLFVGNLEAALNPLLLENLQIGAILSLAKGHPPSKQTARYAKYVPLADDDKDPLLPYLDQCLDFLADRLSQTNVLVHCIAAVSRSPAIAIAFLMRERRLSLEDAFSEVKSRRRIICPSASIMKQLQTYEQQVISKRPALRATSLKNPQPKSRLPSEVSQSSLARGNSAKIHVEDVQEGKSVRSQARSVRTNRQDTINSFQPPPSKRTHNPEDSFLSKTPQLPSELNKSTTTSKVPCEKKSTEQSFLYELPSELPQLSELSLSKKSSSRRDDFTKRVCLLDNRNLEINNKIVELQQKFEQEEKNRRTNFENELQEINEMKSTISSQMSERRTRTHDRSNTQQDKQAKQYMNSLPTAHW